ncbi:MAG: saccharopine dehydrogenase C-terminal domain-containing protein [Gemmatimonadota bacterium]
MRFLVLGGGLQGSACAYDLLKQPDVQHVTIADFSPNAGAPFLPDDPRLRHATVDFSDSAAVAALMAEHDVVLSAAPYYFNGTMARLAIENGCDYSDLGGNTEIVFEQLELDAAAKEAGVSVIPDVGLAPGLVNILAAEGIRRLDHVDSAKMYVGGLPQNPVPPLNYQVVYSLEGALDYYTTPSAIIRDGKRAPIDSLSEIETLEFDDLGTLEAFHTGGGSSTLPWRYEGKVDRLEYKTLRYPGHAEIMRSVREMGLLSDEPVDVKGQSVVPRDAFIAAVTPLLTRPNEPDLVALRVEVSGQKNGSQVTHTWDLLDREDEETGITAMERTTGFTLAVVGLLMGRDVIAETGVMPPDTAVPAEPYLAEMAARGVVAEYEQETG